MNFKTYKGKICIKNLLTREFKENNEIESIEELDYSIIINLNNKQSYEMLYEPINNNQIKILEVYKINTVLPLAKY